MPTRALARDIPPARQRELEEGYARDSRGKTSEQRRELRLKYEATRFKEGDRLDIFRDARVRARTNGGGLAAEYLASGKTRADIRRFFFEIQVECMGLYGRTLNRSRAVDINTGGAAFRILVREIAFEVLQIFEGVQLPDPNDDASKTPFCTAAAKVWHRFVESLHGLHNLPTVAAMRRTNGSDSDAETAVLDAGDFETTLTPRQRERWERIVA